MKRIRCAIYTRKSSEDGLEQDFNSLDAQREACAAYILSQTSEGWTALAERYDDGGISGGTLERPALKRLLADIAAGKIDIVVVYKVDRLTRSLMDFSKLVEAFDTASISFVSVTQSFNTTTSMGRLTLNMLLSFAQFEREVTAERIRDKIAASKAKGMWMGGNLPLGYEPDGRSLRIVQEHADLVRHIFARYLELGNVRLLCGELAADKLRVPERMTKRGSRTGGGKFCRGQIYTILRNPIYIGMIRHKRLTHPGQHAPIVDEDMWRRAQVLLAANGPGLQPPRRIETPSLLAGLIIDEDGQPLIATHTSKPDRNRGGRRRYRYYVSKESHLGGDQSEGVALRIPAAEIEGAVVERLAAAFAAPLSLLADAAIPINDIDLSTIAARANGVAERVRSRDFDVIRNLIDEVEVMADVVVIHLSPSAIVGQMALSAAAPSEPLSLTVPVKLRRTGRAMRLIQFDGRSASAAAPPQPLIEFIAKAHEWWQRLSEGDINVSALAREVGLDKSYVSKVLRLAFLSPPLVSMILNGRQPAHLTAKQLIATPIPLSWAEQQRRFD